MSVFLTRDTNPRAKNNCPNSLRENPAFTRRRSDREDVTVRSMLFFACEQHARPWQQHRDLACGSELPHLS